MSMSTGKMHAEDDCYQSASRSQRKMQDKLDRLQYFRGTDMKWEDVPPPCKDYTNVRGRTLLEKDIESYLKKECKALGWTAEKFTSPQKRSVPDQIITVSATSFFRYGFIWFAEMKRPDGQATPSQQEDHTRRRADGNLVLVLDCYAQVDLALEFVIDVITTGAIIRPPLWMLL